MRFLRFRQVEVVPFLLATTKEDRMQIQVNADHTVRGSERLTAHVGAVVEGALSHFSAQITRVEVHLSDENGPKSGQDDKRCMMEARIEGRHPIAVTHHAASLDQAIEGAADKLARSIEHTIGRLRNEHSAGEHPLSSIPET
jgi:ribosome-associated translation inhibitor RaiA